MVVCIVRGSEREGIACAAYDAINVRKDHYWRASGEYSTIQQTRSLQLRVGAPL